MYFLDFLYGLKRDSKSGNLLSATTCGIV
jgi:hypothetical protein